jgi:WD40 repeat protein
MRVVGLWDTALQAVRGVHRFNAYPSGTAVALSRDGELMAAAATFSTVQLYDTKAMESLCEINIDKMALTVRDLVFSPISNLLAVVADKLISLWDLRATDIEMVHMVRYGGITSGTFSPNGKYFASTTDDRAISLWLVAERVVENRFEGHGSDICGLVFSPDCSLLVAVCKIDCVVWDVGTSRCRYIIATSTPHPTAPVLTPQGHFLALKTAANRINLFETETGIPVSSIEADHNSSAMAFAPDGQLFAWCTGRSTVCIRNTGMLMSSRTGDRKSRMVTAMSFSSDGNLLVTSYLDDHLRAWTMNENGFNCVMTRKEEGLDNVVISPNGSRLALSTSLDSMKVISIPNGKTIGVATRSILLAFLPDSQVLAIADLVGLKLWKLGFHLLTRIDSSGLVYACAFSPDGQQLVWATSGFVGLWSLCERKSRWITRVSYIGQLAFSSNGRWVAGSNKKGLHLMDAASGARGKRFALNDPINRLHFSGDDR